MSKGDDGAMMSLGRLAEILDAHGARPTRWPREDRAAAEALLAASPDARALLEAAAALDQALDHAVAPAPSAALREAVLRAAPGRRQAPRQVPRRAGANGLRGLWQGVAGAFAGELGGLRPAAAVLAVALVLGVLAGGAVETRTAATPADEQSIDVLQLALLDDSYGDF